MTRNRSRRLGLYPDLWSWLRPFRGCENHASSSLGQKPEADATNEGPEKGPQAPCQGQGESGCAAQTEDLADQHVSALVGSDISRVEVADRVQKFGQSFDDQGSKEANVRPEQPKNQAHLQDGQALASEVQGETGPKRPGSLVVEIEQCVLRRSNRFDPSLYPAFEGRNAADEASTSRENRPPLSHRQQGQQQELNGREDEQPGIEAQ